MKVVIIAITAILLGPVHGGVNLKNGNFFVSYTFIESKGKGEDLTVEATYNSKSVGKGAFGTGWGTLMSTKVLPNADGSVMVKENGTGGWTLFHPKGGPDKKSVVESAKSILREKIKKNKNLKKSEKKAIFKKLVQDQEYRQNVYDRLGMRAKVAKGKKFFSSLRGPQTITKLEQGWVREHGNGNKDFFNEEGQLIQVKEKFGRAVSFEREKGLVKKIQDTDGKQIFLEWYPSKKFVKSLRTSEKGKQVKFEYQKTNLTKAVDEVGNIYTFDYDSSSNMTRIGYQQGTGKKEKAGDVLISYYPNNFRVKSYKDRDGDVTKYKYEFDPKNPELNFKTLVTKKNYAGKWITNSYGYEIKRRADGSQYTYKIDSTINGLRSMTTYLPNTLPKLIVRGDRKTEFEYGSDDLLRKKVSKYKDKVIDKIKLSYDPKTRKVNRVEKNNSWFEYKYYDDGTLKLVKNNKGNAYLLTYSNGNLKGLIQRTKKGKKNKFNFKYNAYDRVQAIETDANKRIEFSYDDKGRINGLKNNDDQDNTAAKFWQVYNDLAENVKPSGVNLSI